MILSDKAVYISGSGIISSLGVGVAATEKTLRENRSAIQPLELFSLIQGPALPVGAVSGLDEASPPVPRTHRLAGIAARQAMEGCTHPPDAIIIGTTTGGILTTEELLKSGDQKKENYQHHGLHTVASYLAGEFNCTGPVVVVSTACSSGAVAMAMALKMLRSGGAKTVLAGGVDSLCRLTYFGFHSLQLVDRAGCKPLDQNRQGMAVAEAAGMLLLSTEKPENCTTELLGAGLSCDAYHPAAPHPEGQGAFIAMQSALADAGLKPEEISYINLHGTGTPDNDLAESKAVGRLFTTHPPLSSIKGASGHSLAAAGAIEAVVATIAISQGLMPANTGLQKVDPVLDLAPLTSPLDMPTRAVLSNSFGFGGNNGSLVIGAADTFQKTTSRPPASGLAIHGYSCLTGAGDILETMDRIRDAVPVPGMAGLDTISKDLPPRLIRRLKRLPRMTLSLASKAFEDSTLDQKPGAVFMGTSWGALSETHDFLNRLTESGEQFPSPTDFVGSVHNGPASQVAILFGATGPNITTSGGDYSFEQALFAAELMLDDSAGPAFLLGADEGHEKFSPLFDPSITSGAALADGGGALCVNRNKKDAKCIISMPFYQSSRAEDVVAELVNALPALKKQDSYALIMVGTPAAAYADGKKQLAQFMELSNVTIPVIQYRKITGEFGSASAVATVLAASFFESGNIPGALIDGNDIDITGKTSKILILGLGEYITAMELFRP
ncbi:MAG: 3-oxoacyl-(acyl-carrier-protein) synthase [Desulforhopalus sp.]|jgi:3-oxoacyl-(acyl-carrier-protein) synthase